MKKQIKILTVFGTRPEAIKLAPFIKAVESDSECLNITCATTQHRELQNEALDLFTIKSHYNLDIVHKNQDLSYISCAVLKGVTNVLTQERPDFVVVQGDTTTAFTAALAAFYQKIPVVHVEAGLRTGDISSPFPEEAHRVLILKMAKLRMVPTEMAKENLSKEGIVDNVFMVGNTIVDSVDWGLKNFAPNNEFIKQIIENGKQKILITVHRRENFGKPLEEICSAIKELCKQYPEVDFIWPVHPNPNVIIIVRETLQQTSNLYITKPLLYDALLTLIKHSSILISDSGRIQEEACILGKKIIVLREETERMEIIEARIGTLVGSNKERIITEVHKVLSESKIV
ncbi:non-hydrolyzing UDP-N-acetylglucosamine 2-epimerase [Holospora undulata]|uniref:UDP-N-acetylglucosamine 2-epimerase (non-hydrolyzing) n=1 Tax=Holospora undulata HU1 TaxID=1321371 RepID=A0A061JIM4_9PROT|nr:UDP-N-acetylglucosamine 2-epimerase (non-hydrolyzing) [Holospora undulata]ETZ05458.1 UDP-N-acetylglucosamine 2-epimerase [Holospora undulata HU1]